MYSTATHPLHIVPIMKPTVTSSVAIEAFAVLTIFLPLQNNLLTSVYSPLLPIQQQYSYFRSNTAILIHYYT